MLMKGISFFLQSITGPQSSTDHFSANVDEGNNSEVKPSDTPESMKKKIKTGKSKRKTSSDLARNYIHCMRLVAQKTTVKMSVFINLHGKFRYSLTLLKKRSFSEA